MSEKNLFEIGTRKKFRFETSKGVVSIEDLWDLPLSEKAVSLNEIAKGIKRTLIQEEEDFVGKNRKTGNTIEELKLELVKYIIDVRLKEVEEKEANILKEQKKQKIQQILEAKEDEKLKNLSEEELRKMVE